MTFSILFKATNLNPFVGVPLLHMCFVRGFTPLESMTIPSTKTRWQFREIDIILWKIEKQRPKFSSKLSKFFSYVMYGNSPKN